MTARLIAITFAVAMGACASVHDSTNHPAFKKEFGNYDYCEVEAVRQSAQKSCGVACLVCVLKYWGKPASERELTIRHPLRTGIGYPVHQLQSIAIEQGLLAFAVSLNQAGQKPAAALSEHIARGRPIIVALHCPQGRYFGDPVPLIESLDRRTIHPFGAGRAFKHHYVVVIGENERHYLVMDPAYGIGAVPRQSLLDWWRDESHAALVCSPAPIVSSPSGSQP